MKTYGIVVHRQWADELGLLIKPYLIDTRKGFEDQRIIYAREIIHDGPMLIAKVGAKDCGFPAEVHIPFGVVMLIINAEDDRQFGFVRSD